jgi:hypothetical protein
MTYKVGDLIRVVKIREGSAENVCALEGATGLRVTHSIGGGVYVTKEAGSIVPINAICWTAGLLLFDNEIELVKRPRKRTPPIKRKGYAFWIHNIEHKSKKGIK